MDGGDDDAALDAELGGEAGRDGIDLDAELAFGRVGLGGCGVVVGLSAIVREQLGAVGDADVEGQRVAVADDAERTVEPTLRAEMSATSESPSFTGLPSMETMTSPGLTPALAAGPLGGLTVLTRTPPLAKP